MIALFCMLIVIGLCHCDEDPSKFEVESSINRTIDEVERLIRQDSTLPRLSRSEIVDILFNITSKDIDAYQNKETIEKARKIYQKALMVVLPYKAEDAKENIDDLYTKPPIVRIIADPSNLDDFEAWKNEMLKSSTSTQETRREEQSLENLVVTHASEKTSPKEISKMRHKNHKETYSEVQTRAPLKETLKLDSAPIKFSFNLENLQKQATTTEGPITTRRPVFPGTSSSKNEDIFVVYSTSATTVRTTEVNSKDPSTSEAQTTTRPSKYNQNVLSSDQWRYNAPPSTTTQRTTTSPKSPNLSKVFVEKMYNKEPFLPTIKISPQDAVAPTVISKVEELPKVTSENTQAANAEKSTSIYVTPVSSSSTSSEKPKYSSTYNLNSGGFRRITTMRPEIMELLASIGLRPENITNVEEVFKRNKENLENKTRIPGSNGFVRTTTSGLTAVVPDSPSIVGQNTFENPVPEIGKGMNNLTPDVQLLFQRFGLQTSNPATTTTTSTPKPTVNTNSYTNFKPLPTSKIKDQDMKEFLAMFGLGDNRQRKAMPRTTERPSLIEAVPSNMRQILENIGLISRRTPTKTTRKVEEIKPTEATKFHVFKPHEVQLKDERQKMKINELLDMVKLVQEGKASVKDVRKVADDLLENTKSLKGGPDPLSLEEIIRVYNEDAKNEVKRQQNPKDLVESTTNGNVASTSTTPAATDSVDVLSTTTTTTTTTPATTLTPTASDSAKDGTDLSDAVTPSSVSSTSAGTNLVALEESFGGTTSPPDPVLPTRRRSGLYFLVDWNSFLEVGEDSEKVNLRFEPKAGDRTRFLPVTVP